MWAPFPTTPSTNTSRMLPPTVSPTVASTTYANPYAATLILTQQRLQRGHPPAQPLDRAIHAPRSATLRERGAIVIEPAVGRPQVPFGQSRPRPETSAR